MKIYHYDRNGEFTHASKARPNPKEKGKFLIPNRAVTVEPPKPKNGRAVVWNNGWQQVEDHRGKTVYSATDSKRIEKLGPLPEGYSTEKPPEPEPEPYEPTEHEILLEALREKITPAERDAARDRLINERTER